eukprot:GHVL01024156.1.p1 GENE.GHVL01024156.1~~GHVL01024156.1.p1  ORF type:complete len:238 (-),score=33.61 GHVL01024156.1:454-1167(-)
MNLYYILSLLSLLCYGTAFNFVDTKCFVTTSILKKDDYRRKYKKVVLKAMIDSSDENLMALRAGLRNLPKPAVPIGDRLMSSAIYMIPILRVTYPDGELSKVFPYLSTAHKFFLEPIKKLLKFLPLSKQLTNLGLYLLPYLPSILATTPGLSSYTRFNFHQAASLYLMVSAFAWYSKNISAMVRVGESTDLVHVGPYGGIFVTSLYALISSLLGRLPDKISYVSPSASFVEGLLSGY